MASCDSDAMEKGQAGDSLTQSQSELSSTVCESGPKGTISSMSTFQEIISLKGLIKFKDALRAGIISIRQRLGKEGVHGPRNIRSLYSCPKGYPRLAAFLDSDENFMVYRRFGYVQGRLLLEKQDELRKLEEKLEQCDELLKRKDPTNLMRRDLDREDAERRRNIIEKLEKTFCEYGRLVITAQQLVALNRPSDSEHASVENYIYHTQPLRKKEQAWIQHKEDLVTLRPGREHAWLDTGIEHALKWMHCSLIEFLFCSPETKRKSSLPEEVSKDENKQRSNFTVYYTRSRINRVVVCIITAMITVLLIVPVYILYHLILSQGNKGTDAICIGVLFVFTLAFSAVLSLFTGAKRHEILAAAAAYCAVLVVFLGNVGNNYN